MSERIPVALLQAVAADHRRVRPLPPPWRRAVALVPIGLLSVSLGPLVWGFRANFAQLGPALAWGLSALQVLVGMVLIGAALREAIPGRALSRAALAAVLAAGILAFAAITVASAARAPMTIPAGRWVRWAWECTWMALVGGVPVFVASGWLAARALPTRPAVAGALYGLGAGIVADSGVRLFCWVSDPLHVLVAHGGAIAGLAALGAIAAVAVDRARGNSGSSARIG